MYKKELKKLSVQAVWNYKDDHTKCLLSFSAFVTCTFQTQSSVYIMACFNKLKARLLHFVVTEFSKFKYFDWRTLIEMLSKE